MPIFIVKKRRWQEYAIFFLRVFFELSYKLHYLTHKNSAGRLLLQWVGFYSA